MASKSEDQADATITHAPQPTMRSVFEARREAVPEWHGTTLGLSTSTAKLLRCE
jgi:hypothetical protein